MYRQARNVWAVSYLNRASARNYGLRALRLGSLVGFKKRSEGETWYLYSAIHRRFGASRLSVAPRSPYVRSRSHRGSYICVFFVFCTFRVFWPTYPFSKNTLPLERVHIRGTGARRTTLSQSEPISGLEALFRLARSRAPCACASYVDTLLLFIVTIGRTGR